MIPTLTAVMEQGKLVLDCYIDRADLGPTNTVQDMIDRGIQVNV